MTLEITPASRLPKRVTTELTEEAERLVRFIGRDAAAFEVRWSAPR